MQKKLKHILHSKQTASKIVLLEEKGMVIFMKTDQRSDSSNNPSDSQGKNTDEEMTVTLNLMDGTVVTCAIVTILTVQKQDYIVLLPLDEDGENHDGMVWFYRYSENEADPNEEPILEYIEDDEEYDAVSDAFDEYLDNAEFDELMEQE